MLQVIIKVIIPRRMSWEAWRRYELHSKHQTKNLQTVTWDT
jgi:hypothetical protein